MLLLLIISARLGDSLVDGSPPRPIMTPAPNMTLLYVYVRSALADFYFGG